MAAKKDTLIISGFPGVGKTSLYQKSSGDFIIMDSDSSTFDKKEFPENYICHIKENIGKADIILVSSHKDVRLALESHGIEFMLIYPNIGLKDEYLERYKQRGSTQGFIDLIAKNWELWINEIMELENNDYITKFELKSNEYLSEFPKEVYVNLNTSDYSDW